MKLLLFIDSLGSGGAQRQLVELGKGFKEKGHEVLFLTYHEINFFKPDLDEVGIPVKTVEEPNYLKRILKIRKTIRKEKPDAVLSFLEPANFMATLAGFPYRKWKLVVGERSADPKILKSFKRKFYRWMHLFADYVVANSQTNLNMVFKINPLLKKDKTKVIYNAVNIPRYSKNEVINDGKIKLVVAASIYSTKNLDGLINALKLLPEEKKKELEINWYGRISDLDYYDKCLELIQKFNLQNVVKFHKPVNNIFEKYNEADFVGLFSQYEGFPNAISEAMVLGKPVICTNISDIKYFVREDENGFLCNYNDPKTIKEALIKAIDTTEEERREMGKNNKFIAISQFDKKMIVDEYLNLLM